MLDSRELLRKLNRSTRSGRKSLVPIKTKSAETTTRAGFLAADLRPTMTLSMKRYDLMKDTELSQQLLLATAVFVSPLIQR
jgi:hypothetical protein